MERRKKTRYGTIPQVNYLGLNLYTELALRRGTPAQQLWDTVQDFELEGQQREYNVNSSPQRSKCISCFWSKLCYAFS
jgi:hypothetical protein